VLIRNARETQNLYIVMLLHNMSGQKLTIRLSDSILEGVKKYMKRHPEFMDKSSAIRSLIVKGLQTEGIVYGEEEYED